jgi:hypothetical protein
MGSGADIRFARKVIKEKLSLVGPCKSLFLEDAFSGSGSRDLNDEVVTQKMDPSTIQDVTLLSCRGFGTIMPERQRFL